MKLSLVVPAYNEAENLPILAKEIRSLLGGMFEYEVIFIDDGSKDNTILALKKIAQEDSTCKVISFRRNYGQTAAMSAGIDAAKGEVIIPLDADLQNDPSAIPDLLKKLDQGFDIVSGWRKKRHDAFITRKIPSWIANWIISRITGVHLHDYGCSMKAYRARVLKDVRLYGEMHRFIPAYAAWYGARVAEIPVNHRARKFGQTKYGITRTFRVILDLLTVKFLTKYATKPMHFFGKIGFYSLFLSILSGIFALYLREWQDISFISTPLPLLTIFLILIGILFILLGLLAEIIIRVYFEGQNKKIYLVKEKINFE